MWGGIQGRNAPLFPSLFSIRMYFLMDLISVLSSTYSSDMSSASNSLAREFLTDVNRLCNAVVQRAEAKEDEEEETHMAALGQYLVQGRGFILLTTLNSTIDQVSFSYLVIIFVLNFDCVGLSGSCSSWCWFSCLFMIECMS